MPVRAVLFDFDGVIADTENVHVAAWQRVFAEMAWDVEPEVCSRAAEEDDSAFFRSLLADREIEGGDLTGWIAKKQALTRALLGDSPRLYPGVAELVGRLSGRAAMAVVSGTWRENVEVVLERSGLLGSFSAIVAKEDVSRPKPAPDAYRRALARLKVDPAEAVALEDSPNGLAAAKAAGIRAIAVGHRRPRAEWCEGVPFVPSLGEWKTALAMISDLSGA